MRSSTPVRQVRALALVAVPVFLAACSGTHHASRGSAALRPAQFAVRPNISDPLCNRGRGVRLPARLGGNPVVASGTMADGSTLVAVSDYATKKSVALHSVTRRCAPNRAFGDQGAATITFSSRLQPTHSAAGAAASHGLWVNALTARSGGGAIVAGAYGDGMTGDEWVVGEVTPHGKLDPKFGNGGWTVLPLRGEATAVLQERSGRIIIGGDNGGGGCCTLNWAAALSAHGQLERGFGRHGRTELPTGEDSGVEALALEPNGDILAKVGYGNMGCWGVALAMLTPSGNPVPLFAKRLGRFWRGLGFGAFVGDVYIDGQHITLVGTGQRPCANGPTFSAPSATGLIARFRVDGRPASRTVRFPSRLYGDVQAFRAGDDIVVVESPYADPTHLALTALRPDGSADPRFGSHGRARIHTPWRGRNSALETMVSITKASPRAIVVIATRYGRSQLQIVRLRL
jgi:hypothetical protein